MRLQLRPRARRRAKRRPRQQRRRQPHEGLTARRFERDGRADAAHAEAREERLRERAQLKLVQHRLQQAQRATQRGAALVLQPQ